MHALLSVCLSLSRKTWFSSNKNSWIKLSFFPVVTRAIYVENTVFVLEFGILLMAWSKCLDFLFGFFVEAAIHVDTMQLFDCGAWVSERFHMVR